MGEAKRRKLLGLPPRKDKSKTLKNSEVTDLSKQILYRPKFPQTAGHTKVMLPRRMTQLEVMLMMANLSKSGTRLLSKLKKQS